MVQQSSQKQAIQELLKNNEKQALEEFLTFLRFASVSTDPAYKKDLLACFKWLQDYVKGMGFTVETWETDGHPVLFATHMQAGKDKPTLLIYNHYDVQPVDPLNEWKTPPFEPSQQNGEIIARGASDNKGQCFYVLQALKTLLKRDGRLPINVKLCIEGEEEVGSAGLSKLLQSKKKELQANYLAIVDLGLNNIDSPAVTLGTRGIITMTLTLEGSNGDLHSGSFGGMVFNPLHAVVKILGSLRDEEGRVTIPGFYDAVVEMTDSEKKQAAFKFDPNNLQRTFGATATGGEKAYSPLERAWTRPTLEVNGITGGYGGAGFKTVIPAKATAKISCRLVPNQDPNVIGELVVKHIKSLVPAGIKAEVTLHPGRGKAIRTSPNSVIVQAFAQAYADVFAKPCDFIFEGGSIPIAPELAAASGAEVVFMGLALPDDKVHAPNEHFGWQRVQKGALVIARALELLA